MAKVLQICTLKIMNLEQYRQIVVKQEQLNSAINNNWRDKKREWYRAIWVECAEIIEHHGWKWWKKQEKNKHHIQMELVDVLHFGISALLQYNSDEIAVAQQLASALENPQKRGDFCLLVEQFTLETLRDKTFALNLFGEMCLQMELDSETLFKYYMGKNTLNQFRQDMGYRQGSYQKIWNGREDNDVLIEIVQNMSVTADNFAKDLYRQLLDSYKRC